MYCKYHVFLVKWKDQKGTIYQLSYLWSGIGPCHQLFIHLEAPFTVVLNT